MVFPSLSPFAGPLLGGSQPTNAEPPRDRGRGSPSWLNVPRRACQLQRWGDSTSRCRRLILRATPSLRFSAAPTPDTAPWVHRRPLPGHTAHHDYGRRARHRAHLQHQRREQRRKRTASTNASDGEPGDDSGGQAPDPFSGRRLGVLGPRRLRSAHGRRGEATTCLPRFGRRDRSRHAVAVSWCMRRCSWQERVGRRFACAALVSRRRGYWSTRSHRHCPRP